MNITHDHIRSIVGTEPQEWWPEGVVLEFGKFYDNGADCPMEAIVAYHAFVGAAFRRMRSRGPVSSWQTGALVMVTFGMGSETKMVSGPCDLSALVRAIGEVK